MLKDTITTVLFDLDGTLLPMDQEQFTRAYFGLLVQKAAPFGLKPQPTIEAVWAGTKAMVKNDGSVPNHRRFWDTFCPLVGVEEETLRPVFDKFYAQEFHGARSACGENPYAKRAVQGLRDQGYDVILATNPIFPLEGVRTRLSWVGLTPEDFSLVTTYESSSYTKPNPAYFTQILQQAGKRPQECLMVGNDLAEDTGAVAAGLSLYVVTDCLENGDKGDLSQYPHGSFQEFLSFAGLS